MILSENFHIFMVLFILVLVSACGQEAAVDSEVDGNKVALEKNLTHVFTDGPSDLVVHDETPDPYVQLQKNDSSGNSGSETHVGTPQEQLAGINYDNITDQTEDPDKICKLLPPGHDDLIYFGAFPDFGGPEDNVTRKRILDFEKLIGRNITWAYFSQNWFDGISYPKKEIHMIDDLGIIPFIRLMPRSDEEQFRKEHIFSLQNIVDGMFDEELKTWADEAKEDNVPLLADFAVEMNGNWFSWSGYYNGKGKKDSYGDPDYPDGPELYRDAYRHIIDLFRKRNVTHITWFFHFDIYSDPDEWWNQPEYYYPGDDYIDWIGISIYGPQHPNENYWETFSEILESRYRSILDVSDNKPVAVLEFGVTDDHPLGDKAEWLEDAFQTILNKKFINFKAISYWHETWEEDDDLYASIRVDSSEKSLSMFRKQVSDPRFISTPIFISDDTTPLAEKDHDNIADKDTVTGSAIYRPKPEITWQWQLSGELNIGYDVDLYDIDLFETPKTTIDELHKRGIKVICYFNAGAYEPYRPDSAMFTEDVLGKNMDGWEDERWLDISKYDLFSDIMEARLDLAAEKGCDGVEPDNIDAYTNDNGFALSYEDQLKYNIWLSDEAHKRYLSIALKNDLDQIDDLVDHFDLAINEQCFYYDECDALKEFIAQDKAVLGVEYELDTKDFCKKAKTYRFSWLKMGYELDGKRISCDGI